MKEAGMLSEIKFSNEFKEFFYQFMLERNILKRLCNVANCINNAKMKL